VQPAGESAIETVDFGKINFPVHFVAYKKLHNLSQNPSSALSELSPHLGGDWIFGCSLKPISFLPKKKFLTPPAATRFGAIPKSGIQALLNRANQN
jgi:hypothetical protein